MRILFWNTHKNKDINPYIASLVLDNEIDILALSEYDANIDELNAMFKDNNQRLINRGAYRNKAPTYAFRALKSPTGIERSGVKRIRLHDLRHSHARNRRVFLPTGIKRWTESEKYGKISIRNDIVKSEFIKEDMDETVFMFALFKCRKFDKRRN